MQRLKMRGTRVTDECLHVLQSLPRLIFLDARDTKMSVHACKVLSGTLVEIGTDRDITKCSIQ